jgi:hypothetical protein
MLTLRSATCISANLNGLRNAIDAVQDRDQRGQLSTAFAALAANLYATYYDVLPIIDGQKSWPKIMPGDTWSLDGRPMPYPDRELSQ